MGVTTSWGTVLKNRSIRKLENHWFKSQCRISNKTKKNTRQWLGVGGTWANRNKSAKDVGNVWILKFEEFDFCLLASCN